MNILLIGDIYGKTGRQAVAKHVSVLKKEYALDMIIANGENAAGGSGITKKVLTEIYDAGINVVTSGNHIWDKKEIFEFIDDETTLVRPANYPPGLPGQGYCVFQVKNKKIGVMNLLGRSFMPALDCPFRKADEILAILVNQCDYIILDFHAETTSEKLAMAWYLDGRVQCIVGTHTHVQTADERILPNGTAYITDLGMTGPWNSILGVDKEPVIKKFLTGLPVRFEPAKGPHVFCGIIVNINETTKQATQIQRIMLNE